MGTHYGPENTGPVRRFGEGGGSTDGLLSLPDAQLDNVLWVDVSTACPPGTEDGSCQLPYHSIDAAVNAAAALVPAPGAGNPVAIIVMPGEYREQVQLDVPHVHLFGFNRETTILKNGGLGGEALLITTQYTSVQGLTIEATDTTNHVVIVDWDPVVEEWVEFRECYFQVPAPPNGGDGSVLVQDAYVRFIDCDFVAPYTANRVLYCAPGAFHVTMVELYACRVHGYIYATQTSGTLYVFGCEIDGKINSTIAGAWYCFDTRITATSGAAIPAVGTGTVIQDCVLTSQAGNYDIDDDTGGKSFICANVIMWTGGIHEDHDRSNPTRYVGGPGDADWYQTTWHAQRTGAPRLIVLLKDDVITSALQNYGGNPTTIRGNGHSLTANGCDLVTMASGGWLRFEHITLVGLINIVNGVGTIELLEGTYLTGNIYVDYCGNDNLMVILDGAEVSGQIILEDANGYGSVVIKRSRVKGAAGSAIYWKDPGSPAPTPVSKLKIKYSTIWNTNSGAPPFQKDAVFAAVTYYSHHSRYNMTPDGGGGWATNAIAVAQRFDSYDVQTDY